MQAAYQEVLGANDHELGTGGGFDGAYENNFADRCVGRSNPFTHGGS